MMDGCEKRTCPVCGGDRSEILCEQSFRGLLGISGGEFRQVIVICRDCGMSYTNPFLGDEVIESYYRFMSTYDYAEHDYEYGEPHKKRSERQVAYILSGTGQADEVLDIGCSIGYTLHLFRKRGSRQVIGVEPSPSCATIAKEKFGIEIKTGPFRKEIVEGRRFDVILLSHVLEHLKHPAAVLEDVRPMLKEDGALFVEVPDIDLFDERDPYQFSFEHINYFNLQTLRNLMSRCGFAGRSSKVFENIPDTAPFYPTLGTLWSRNEDVRASSLQNCYGDNKVRLMDYIAVAGGHKERLGRKIDGIVQRNKRLGIWGAGTMTAQLLSQTNLLTGNVVVIFDNDPKKSGSTVCGVEVVKPPAKAEFFKERVEGIVIGSWSSQKEIYADIRFLEKEGIEIYRLFDE
jgi:2-polyprenyl-3-methyl-5-hydroxy-6-metoxy-1,4-benzoquinol methylase